MFDIQSLKMIEESLIDSYVSGRFYDQNELAETLIYDIHRMISAIQMDQAITVYEDQIDRKVGL
jgi:hypothetical protein